MPTEAGEIEVDAYRGPLEGLVTAEIEFSPGQSPGSFERPNWIGEEVTDQLGYANKNSGHTWDPERPWPRRVITIRAAWQR